MTWLRAAGCAASIALMLVGCDLRRLSSSAEERVNQLQPVTPALARAIELARAEGKADSRWSAAFDDELARKMKVRAIECGKGFSPTWRTPDDEVSRNIDRECTARRDAETERWVGRMRAGLLAGTGPLRPIPTAPPATITASEPISRVFIADNAGVALLSLNRHSAVVDLADGSVIFQEANPRRGAFGQLSPNGQMFIHRNEDEIWLRASRNGDRLVQLHNAPAPIHWLGDDALLLDDEGALRIVDLRWGRDYPLGAAIRGTGLQAAPAPDGAEREFVLVGVDALMRIALPITADQTPPVRLLAERRVPFAAKAFSDGRSVDGRTYANVLDELSIYDLTSLEITSVGLSRYTFEHAWPTPTPGHWLIQMIPKGRADERALYMFSVPGQTFARVDTNRLPSTHFVFMRPLRRLGVFSQHPLRILPELTTGSLHTAQALEEAELQAANERKLQAIARAAALGERDPDGVLASKLDGTLAGLTPEPGPVATLARDSIVEAIGIYQAGERGSDASVRVLVRRSARPMVLVLSAYEAVRWHLRVEPGAQLVAVLTSGYHPQTVDVVGAIGPRVLQIGTHSPYKREATRELERDVFRITGKPISIFQGAYAGRAFIVGGR